MAPSVDGDDEDAVDDDDDDAEEGRTGGLDDVGDRRGARVLEHGRPAGEVRHVGHRLTTHHFDSFFLVRSF